MTTGNSLQALQQQLTAMVSLSASGVIIAAMAGGMSKFVLSGMAMTAGMGTKESAAQELANVDERIRKLSFVMENYRSSVISLRNNRQELMMEYGITVTPALAPLKNLYPKLYHTEMNLKKAEEELAKIEVRDLLLKKRRKELRFALGIGPVAEAPPHIQYTAMKKFVPKEPLF